MRRGISIVLVLLFWMGPLTAIFAAGSDDLRLPACCRRHGAHHCAMSTEQASALAAANSGTLLRAPSSCPLFPHYPAALSGSLALAATAAHQASSIATLRRVARGRDSISLSAIDARTSRGPPAATLS